MANPIQHVEWTTRDAARLKAFYGAVFDWQFPEWMPGYSGVMTGDKGVGGIMQIPDGEPIPTGITCYVTVDDIGATEEKIRAAGGQIYKSNQEVPNTGWFTILGDPDGNTIAIWKQHPAAVQAPPAQEKPAKKARKAAKAVRKAAKKAAKAVKKAAKKAKPVKKAKKAKKK